MRWLVGNLTEPGDLVVDPFAGSGTTGIAAVQLGRRAHLIEIDAEYRDLAGERLDAWGRADENGR
jgi:DNA modification methylase